jgi:hypothetical protein
LQEMILQYFATSSVHITRDDLAILHHQFFPYFKRWSSKTTPPVLSILKEKI